MGLRIFSNKEQEIKDEDAWEHCYNTFQDIEKQVELRKKATSTGIIKDFLPMGGKVLDAGCGNGGFLISFKELRENKFFFWY